MDQRGSLGYKGLQDMRVTQVRKIRYPRRALTDPPKEVGGKGSTCLEKNEYSYIFIGLRTSAVPTSELTHEAGTQPATEVTRVLHPKLLPVLSF